MSHPNLLTLDKSGNQALNFSVLKRIDAGAEEIVATCNFCVVYEFVAERWAKKGIEGPLFVVRGAGAGAGAAQRHRLWVLNRAGRSNLAQDVLASLELARNQSFYFLRDAGRATQPPVALWFPDEEREAGEAVVRALDRLVKAARASGAAAASAASAAVAAAAATTSSSSAAAAPSGATAAWTGGEDAGRAAFLRTSQGERKKSERWRLFSLGIVLGLAFGAIQVGIPAISGLLLDKPIFLIPQPFIDTTTLTEALLPATPTGLVLDLGVILMGFVLPFWAVVGTAAAIVLTVIANPLLQHAGLLTRWQPGMDTINTTFANSMDFWMSFGIGSAFAIAAVSIFQTVRDVRRRVRELSANPASSGQGGLRSLWATPRTGRGDYSMWFAVVGYVVVSVILIALCYALLKDTGTNRIGLLIFLSLFTFVYNPLISYVNARLLGISGQSVDIPFIKETAFILSGAKGVEVWLAPIPITNYGGQAQGFRVNELTGVSFRSLIKADLLLLPFMFCLSWVFWAFIWHASPIPSDAFPAAQINWELRTKTDTLLYTSTFAPPGALPPSILDSEFMQAIHKDVVCSAFGLTTGLFVLFSVFGLPTLFIYGIIRGLGALPHTMALEIVGAMIGRYYYQKKYGSTNFLRMAPTLLAGYFTGVGLISMVTIAMRLIQAAKSAAPF